MKMLNDFFETFNGWFCEVYDLTLDELLGHIHVRFTTNESDLEFIRHSILIDHHLQINAEKILIDFINAHSMNSSRMNGLMSDQPGKNIDWSRTKVEHLTGNNGRYWNQSKKSIPDLQLRMGLANLISRWVTQVRHFLPGFWPFRGVGSI